MNTTEREQLQGTILTLMQDLQGALGDLRTAAEAYAQADHAYRQKRAAEYIKAVAMTRPDGKPLTVDHCNAMVDLACDTEMLCVRLAEARRDTAKEFVRAIQAQISAGQTLLGAERAEANALRYGQTVGA